MATTNLNIRTELDVPNETTMTAIEEGRRILSDSSVKGYTDMQSLKEALEK